MDGLNSPRVRGPVPQLIDNISVRVVILRPKRESIAGRINRFDVILQNATGTTLVTDIIWAH